MDNIWTRGINGVAVEFYDTEDPHLPPEVLTLISRLAPSAISEYIRLCRESILALHHFFELTIKEILRLAHPALACKAPTEHEDICGLLLGRRQIDGTGLETLEAAQAIKRLKACVEGGFVGFDRFAFLVEHETQLMDLTKLRNRIWHKGNMFLSPQALDECMVRYFLPLVVKVFECGLKSARAARLLGTTLQGTPFSPLIELGKLAKGRDLPASWKVAFLKETGRALFTLMRKACGFHETDLFTVTWPAPSVKSSIGLAEFHNELRNVDAEGRIVLPIRDCPVCGESTLVSEVYEELDENRLAVDDSEHMHAPVLLRWIHGVTCFHCSFRLAGVDFRSAKGFMNINFEELFKDITPER